MLTVLVSLNVAYSAPLQGETSNIESLLHGLERLVSFYKTANRQLNIDGLYGLRVIEGMGPSDILCLFESSVTNDAWNS